MTVSVIDKMVPKLFNKFEYLSSVKISFLVPYNCTAVQLEKKIGHWTSWKGPSMNPVQTETKKHKTLGKDQYQLKILNEIKNYS